MATPNVKIQCSICNNDEDTYECKGCSQIFCYIHLSDHHENINKEFNQIEDDYNLFKQIFYGQKNNPEKLLSIKQIEQWKKESINKIEQTAKECRDIVINYTNYYFIRIENKLNELTHQIKETQKKNKVNEMYFKQIKQNLNKLKEELDKSSSVSIQQQSSAFIKKIFVIKTFEKDRTWKQQGITINREDYQENKLYHPDGIFIDDDQNIYVADWGNHRIVEWKSNATNGQIVAGGNGQGNQMNQLNHPTDVIIDKENNSFIIADSWNRRIMRWSRQNNTKNGEIIIKNIDCIGLTMDEDGSLYVSDWKKNEVRRWKRGDQNGTIVAGGNGNGNNLNQFNVPTSIFIDEDDSLYVSDLYNHRVMKWLKDAKEGIVVAGGNGHGNNLTELSSPRRVVVDQLGQIYVADWGNHRVMRWCLGAKEGTIVVGGNGEGEQSNQFNGPTGLSFDRQGNLYVADCRNNRIQKFEIN